MKKTNTKTKSPAPATSSAKPTRKKAGPNGSLPQVSTAAAVTTAPAAVVATPAPAAPAVSIKQTPSGFVPPVRAVVSSPVQTRIVARVDVGFGNTLFIRGEGPGLSWSQGVPMECVAGDQWEYVLGESARPVSFKVLINDSVWCSGPDSVAASGSTTTITPEFL